MSSFDAPSGARLASSQLSARTLTRSRAAYIDSRLALLRSHGDTTAAGARSTELLPTRAAAAAPISASMAATRRAPATVGRLQEIDLGPAAAQRNEAATLAATQQQQQQQQQAHGTHSSKDKAPPRRRGRARRTSADVARDAIVEALMAENKRECLASPVPPRSVARHAQPLTLDESRGTVDHYDATPTAASHAAGVAPATATTSAPAAEDDLAADERVAAEFTRNFLDAAQARRDARPPPASASAGGAGAGGAKKKKTGAGDAPRGPKLGGSRSARAAMRAQAEAAKAASKAGR